MIFKIPSLKGYVEFNNGEIIPHGDPETKYMKDLIERAENWKRVWEESDKPDYDYLSDDAKKIVDAVNVHIQAVKQFSVRVKKQIETGVDRERNIKLWYNWLPDMPGRQEAARYFYEQQMYEILKEENV